ncbi:MAG: hypothetical protein ACNYPE_12895 [Candidatus Azotimanducaceae bacterium WSBS_2022_MAG_OTU7]
MSEIIKWDGGLEPASPMPTPILASASWKKLCAYPHITLMPLQMVIATVTTFRRLRRSASIAMGIPRVA